VVVVFIHGAYVDGVVLKYRAVELVYEEATVHEGRKERASKPLHWSSQLEDDITIDNKHHHRSR